MMCIIYNLCTTQLCRMTKKETLYDPHKDEPGALVGASGSGVLRSLLR